MYKEDRGLALSLSLQQRYLTTGAARQGCFADDAQAQSDTRDRSSGAALLSINVHIWCSGWTLVRCP